VRRRSPGRGRWGDGARRWVFSFSRGRWRRGQAIRFWTTWGWPRELVSVFESGWELGFVNCLSYCTLPLCHNTGYTASIFKVKQCKLWLI
jgi:hypothetical protein